MIATVISQYLRDNRRLVIPQLGAFLVKEPGQRIVFSPLLTRDDGVLRQLLLDAGVSEVAAVGLMDRLLFDVRFVMENGGDYLLEGVGRFALNTEGKLHFETDTVSRREAVAQMQETASEPVEQESNPFFMFDKQSPVVAAEPLQQVVPEPREVEEDTPTHIDADPDLEGLSYGEKSVSRSNRTRAARHAKPKKRRRGGVDWWLVIGVTALLLALGSILYGFMREGAEPISLTTFVGQESQK
ncbi:MAG: hypothetical protein SNI45_07060 [Rikenellaceae bacterium]